MNQIQNPILRGFHPDPSIIRVGEDYYIATSTFEWWPGVRLHHSRDLVHWELIEYPLNRVSQLDLRGVGPSQGIWAPCLTWDKGVFYLVYTVVKAFYCNMYDTENYLVTARDIHGPWSEPVALNNFGFDPSLFHDDDGRKYMVSMVTDHRVTKKYVGRLVLQEFDDEKGRMTGPVRDIYRAEGIFLEGPHILKRRGWYYLFSADTGTGEGHGQTIQRSRDIWGPYEMYRPLDEKRQEGEAFSILTSRHHEDILLQKAGHCDLDYWDNPDAASAPAQTYTVSGYSNGTSLWGTIKNGLGTIYEWATDSGTVWTSNGWTSSLSGIWHNMENGYYGSISQIAVYGTEAIVDGAKNIYEGVKEACPMSGTASRIGGAAIMREIANIDALFISLAGDQAAVLKGSDMRAHPSPVDYPVSFYQGCFEIIPFMV